jgi:MEMO1 family protein
MAILSCKAGDDKASVRPPAVAGQFYPGNASQLKSDVQGYLSKGTSLTSTPVMMVVPHAGYVFSAPVAAKGYAAIDRATSVVTIIGPSHHAAFRGISISDADFYEAPLGRVPLNKEIIGQLRKSPLVSYVARADEPEHSVEVQIPFLQVVLSSFTIVPILTGDVDPADVAKLLLPFVKKHTLVVASSDFSHYHADSTAQRLDKASIGEILAGHWDGVIDACGEMPIRVIMHMAGALDLKPLLVDARNSYQTAPEYGSPDRVVGYATIAFLGTLPEKVRAAAGDQGKAKNPDDLAPAVKSFLLKLARSSLTASVKRQSVAEPTDIPEVTKKNSGCFVTLTKHGDLRGCIGNIEPVKPLYKGIIDNARNAALEDPRFPAVTPDELGDLKVEVSVLTEPVPLPYASPQDLLDKLVPGKDGIILEKGFSRSTFLPQVWDQLSDKVEFLEHLSMKGGMPRDGWKTATVKRYYAIHFAEEGK